jgi:membrane-associated phospholipid phosphatase
MDRDTPGSRDTSGPAAVPGPGQPASAPAPGRSRPSADAGSRAGRPVIRFLAATLLAGAGVVVVRAVFVLTEAGQRLENLALSGAALQTTADREASLGRLSVVSILTVAAALVLVVMVGAARRRLGLGLLIAAAMGVAVVLAEVLKDALSRPELVSGPAWLLRNSFPSGHAAIGAAIGMALLLLSPDRLRWLALPIGALLSAFLGQATQVAGWHRTSDAFGGVLLAMAVLSAALVVLAVRGFVRPSTRGLVSARVHRSIAAVGGGLILLGLLILAIAALFPILRAPAGAEGAFLYTTLDLVGSGATLLAFVAFSLTIEPFSLGSTEEEPQSAVAASPDPSD